MENSSFSSTFMSVTTNFTPELRWLPSVFSGIVMCNVVYKLTGHISNLCFGGYRKLSGAQKIEWNNRGFSTFHAVVVAAASVYLLLFSNLFDEKSQDELIVNRSSTLSNSILGISIGYFVSDLAMILWHFPALGGMEYVLHHGLSLLSIYISLVSGQGQLYILMVLFSESTTPFVNLRWYLDVAGLKNSKPYVLNGILLFLGWLVARIILFIFFFMHMIIHFDEVKEICALGFYVLVSVGPTLAVMNLIWFWKIVKGLIKTLSKAKQSSD